MVYCGPGLKRPLVKSGNRKTKPAPVYVKGKWPAAAEWLVCRGLPRQFKRKAWWELIESYTVQPPDGLVPEAGPEGIAVIRAECAVSLS